jgi:hypothetical protein
MPLISKYKNRLGFEQAAGWKGWEVAVAAHKHL